MTNLIYVYISFIWLWFIASFAFCCYDKDHLKSNLGFIFLYSKSRREVSGGYKAWINQAKIPVVELGHPPSYKTLNLQFVLPVRCAQAVVAQNLWNDQSMFDSTWSPCHKGERVPHTSWMAKNQRTGGWKVRRPRIEPNIIGKKPHLNGVFW